MAVILKCAACGADVEFAARGPLEEATCPGCEVRVRQRKGDESMAIPVSMSLPEKFQPVDLSSVADKSSLLVGRYRKTAEQENKGESGDMALAKALEALASSIASLDVRLTKQERQSEENMHVLEDLEEALEHSGQEVPHHNGASKTESEPEELEEPDEVIQLEEEKAEPVVKAVPVGARVLVRHEAAKEAHEFRRERQIQVDWDDSPKVVKRPMGFSYLMECYPKTTIVVTFLGAVGIIVATILAMQGMWLTKKDPEMTAPPLIHRNSLGELWADDPQAGQAEANARGFLNASSARSAAPFVFESDSIRGKFEKYYRPIASPDSYELKFKSRALTRHGPSFNYWVEMPGKKRRMLVVLPEGKMPKVFWEFFAEVGDMTWSEFMEQRPTQPVEMRVWAYPAAVYSEVYPAEDWQSYILHDFGEKYKVYAYVDRGTGDEWRISNALKKEPVKFNNHSAVMARVKMNFQAELVPRDGERIVVVEIKDVIATSWLPERFLTSEEE